jgi:hypothetical protein
MSIPAQASQICDDEGSVVETTQTEGVDQLGPVGPPVPHDVNDFGDKLPLAAVQVGGNGPTLRLQAKATMALHGRGHPQI